MTFCAVHNYGVKEWMTSLQESKSSLREAKPWVPLSERQKKQFKCFSSSTLGVLLRIGCVIFVCHEATARTTFQNGLLAYEMWQTCHYQIRGLWGHSVGSLWALLGIVLVCVLISAWTRRKYCYLVDYSCCKPPDDRKVSTDLAEYFILREEQYCSIDGLEFRVKIHLNSGIGQETYLPDYLFSENQDPTLKERLQEMVETFGACLNDLFSKTHVRPSEVGILIVNVSTFSPAPSLAAWIVNRYKLKENVKIFNLAGMGCSGSLVAVDLAKDLLGIYANSYAIVVSSECITGNVYNGNEKSMMITDCLYRVGGAAMLLSNKRSEAKRAKMQLMHLVRTQTAANPDAYNCVLQKEDAQGFLGINLRPDPYEMGHQALQKNLTSLGPKVLPVAELLRCLCNQLRIRKFKTRKAKAYVPNFKLAVEHFCIQPVAKAFLEDFGRNLRLSDYDMEASQMTLHRFGNIASASVWYELAYLEAKGRLRKGDRVWQAAMGSGIKCNSAVWKVMQDIKPVHSNVWMDSIDRYPCDTRNPFDKDLRDHITKVISRYFVK